jgi:hypothetical protein
MLDVMRCLMDTANVVPSRQKGGLGFESPNRLSAWSIGTTPGTSGWPARKVRRGTHVEWRSKAFIYASVCSRSVSLLSFILLLSMHGAVAALPGNKKAKAPVCGRCAKDADCGPELACSRQVHLCEPPETLAGEAATCPADCALEQCRTFGWCFFDSRASRCEAIDDTMCAQSDVCAHSGSCKAVGGECVVQSEADCLASSACQRAGLCRFRGHECRAESDEDCQKSLACHWRGYCYAIAGFCGVRSDAECRASARCKESGLCRAHSGLCYATEADCVSSEDCKLFGLCHQVGDRCAAIADEDCRESSLCKTQGYCFQAESECTGRRMR